MLLYNVVGFGGGEAAPEILSLCCAASAKRSQHSTNCKAARAAIEPCLSLASLLGDQRERQLAHGAEPHVHAFGVKI